jgi:hypothetical protein
VIADDEALLARLATTLSVVPGVRAVVLGGSRAQGTAKPDSDYDIGIYYDGDSPFPLESMQGAAAALGDPGSNPAVTPRGAWGEWIDGGGWLTIAGRKVDWLYRDLRRVRRVIGECRAGSVQVAYQPGHPHAFVSAILMGEVSLCRPLWDPGGAIRSLKRETQPYPGALRSALVQRFLWEAEFALDNAQKSADRHDVAHVAGCCFRSVACVVQVVFALNGRYLINEKGSVAAAKALPIRPDGMTARVEGAFRSIGAGDPREALEQLRGLVRRTAALAAEAP